MIRWCTAVAVSTENHHNKVPSVLMVRLQDRVDALNCSKKWDVGKKGGEDSREHRMLSFFSRDTQSKRLFFLSSRNPIYPPHLAGVPTCIREGLKLNAAMWELRPNSDPPLTNLSYRLRAGM